MNIPAPFTLRQHEYLLRSQGAWLNVAEGGKRGGKNVLQTIAFCIALEEHPAKLHLVAGVSIATARLNIIDCDGLGLLNFFEYRCALGRYQARDCLYVDTRTGRKIVLISGGGTAGDEKLIKGNTYGMAYITEANECTQAFVQEVFDRTLSSPDRKIFHDLNPKAEGHWYYREVLSFHESRQRKDPGYGLNYGHFTIADNLSVKNDALARLLGTYDRESIWFRRDILGERRQVKGLIYPMFDEKRHVTSHTPDIHTLSFAADIGHSNATAFLSIGEGADGRVYVLSEYYHAGKGQGQTKSPLRYAQDFIAFRDAARKAYPWAKQGFLIIDPAALGFRAQLNELGEARIRKAKNGVLAGIQAVASAIDMDLIRIDGACKMLLSEMAGYVWDENAAEHGEDRPVKENDHALDALRYYMLTMRGGPGNAKADARLNRGNEKRDAERQHN